MNDNNDGERCGGGREEWDQTEAQWRRTGRAGEQLADEPETTMIRTEEHNQGRLMEGGRIQPPFPH